MQGARLAVDVGTVRVGVAVSDPAAVLALPLTTLRRNKADTSDLDELAALVEEHQVVEVLVGLPRTLAGREGSAVQMAREYGTALAERVAPIPVRFVDERLSSVVAAQQLRTVRPRGGGRAAAAARRAGEIDQRAAAAILQTYLDGLAREEGR